MRHVENPIIYKHVSKTYQWDTIITHTIDSLRLFFFIIFYMSTDSKWIWLSSIISQHITSYPFTLSPRASTIPEHSNPGTRGVLGGLSMFPCRTIKSMKFKPLWMANVKRETFRMESKRIHLAWLFFCPLLGPLPFPTPLSFLFIYLFFISWKICLIVSHLTRSHE